MQANGGEISGYSLGIDLGVRSVGLALVEPEGRAVLHTAACVFPAGVEGDFEAGRDDSNNTKRREARLARRQTERRARRLKKIFHLLQEAELLPPGDAPDCLRNMDLELARKYPAHAAVPYLLRKKALDGALTREELGRALYHLAQRRGFQSNRKAPIKEDEESGKVAAGIETLAEKMAAAGARTLGEYFAGVDPHVERIRTRYTARPMYRQEFESICEAQQQYHAAALTEGFRARLSEAMFHQRPLKDQSHLVGHCSLMPEERRAPIYHLDAQRFRILDRVNNLRFADGGAELPAEQRQKLAAELGKVDVLSYARVRQLLGLPRTAKFSIEEGGEKNIRGNATWARFGGALNLRWDEMSRGEQDGVVEMWAEADDDEAFRRALEGAGCYSAEEMDALAKVRLPQDRIGFSLKAIGRLLPHLEAGLTTAEARKREFPESFEAGTPEDRLPPVMGALPELRNPAVMRSLTMLRKAVNEVVRRYGKPAEIHIELARDLKRNKKDRQAMTKNNRENEARRAKAREALRSYYHHEPSRYDLDKYLLWEECGHECPYSGRAISLQALYDRPLFEIEHIIPESRSLDDSFQNKTLCARDYNGLKKNRTPWEAFGGGEEWEVMADRVRKWGNKGKLKRFLMMEIDTAKLLSEFSTNQLNDTRYMSRLAGKYLGLLYGGVSDAEHRQRIFVCAGQVTARLRRYWRLNHILNDKPEKTREDHRHHAVDAAAVAMATPKIIQTLALESARAEEAGQRRLKDFPEPWAGFTEQVRDAILNRTVVSHKPERKLAGALHEETLYGRPQVLNGKNVVHIRKPLHTLNEKDIEAIVDVTVRERVRLQLGRVGSTKRLEAEPPTIETKDGRSIPIRRVRIRMTAKTERIGTGARQRNVVTGDNHHMEVVAVRIAGKKGKAGATKYEGCVVSRLEANRRHGKGEPVVRRDHGEDREFLFTLSEGDMVRWKGEIWRVRGVTGESSGRMTLSKASDARLKKELEKDDLLRPSVNVFCSTGGRKVRVSPLGVISEAND